MTLGHPTLRIPEKVVGSIGCKAAVRLTDDGEWLIWIRELRDMGAGQHDYWLSPIRFNYKMLGVSLAVEKYRFRAISYTCQPIKFIAGLFW